MNSKYWDDFERRIGETVCGMQNGEYIPVRRVAVFITNKCNFKCHYCNVSQSPQTLSIKQLDKIVKAYGGSAIIHITGGEPSIIPGLYDYINSTPKVSFHLNTNAYIKPPSNIKRLKVSLDSLDKAYFDDIVQVRGAFERVVKNVKEASKNTTTTITCTLTKENYKAAPKFMEWCRNTFPDLYAVFFSVYKGDAKRFAFTPDDAKVFFNEIKPKLEYEMDAESLSLIQETIDEKKRIMQGIRFPENVINKPCYISMSERVFDCNGSKWNCSHLFRDGILQKDNTKHEKCLYGCNRRLVAFNEKVEELLWGGNGNK